MASAYARRKAQYRLRRAWGDLSATLWTSRLVRLHKLSRILLFFAVWGICPGASLCARSVPGLLTRNCGLLRTGTAAEKRLVNALAWANQRSGSFTVCPAPSRPSQRLIAARLLPDAGNGIEAPGLWPPLPRFGSPGLGQRVSWAGGTPVTRYRRRGTAPAGEELTGMVNLDDTRHCPVGPAYKSCGRLDALAVSTADTPAGVLCMTVCDACELIAVPRSSAQRRRPPASLRTVSTWESRSTR
jgi:hypothetical protein